MMKFTNTKQAKPSTQYHLALQGLALIMSSASSSWCCCGNKDGQQQPDRCFARNHVNLCAHGTKTARPLYPSSLHCMTKTWEKTTNPEDNTIWLSFYFLHRSVEYVQDPFLTPPCPMQWQNPSKHDNPKCLNKANPSPKRGSIHPSVQHVQDPFLTSPCPMQWQNPSKHDIPKCFKKASPSSKRGSSSSLLGIILLISTPGPPLFLQVNILPRNWLQLLSKKKFNCVVVVLLP
jgi:hypothetical protein